MWNGLGVVARLLARRLLQVLSRKQSVILLMVIIVIAIGVPITISIPDAVNRGGSVPATATSTPTVGELTEQLQRWLYLTSDLCSIAEQERERYRSLADQILAYSDRIMQDNVITVTEGEQLRERDARLDRQLQTTSTAEQNCANAKERVEVLEGALRRVDAKPTATATPKLTPTNLLPTATPTRFPTPVPTPTPTAGPTPTPKATPTPTATPIPVPQRYQVFFDDIELVKDSDLWNWTNCQPRIDVYEQRKQRALEVGGREPHRPIGRPCLHELEQRIQLLRHEPEPEQEKHWAGICRSLDEQVYIPTLYSVAVESGPSFLYHREEHALIFNWHAGDLRMFLITDCSEHVPYEPYPEPPQKDCSDFDYREDAGEYVYTYWYAEHIGDLIDREYSSTWGTTREIVCGYLPSRG